MAALAVTAIVLGFGFWILLPLLRLESFSAGEYEAAGELKDLCALKEAAYDTLRDIEFDFRMGKIAEKDYLELKTRYQGEAAEVVGQIEALEKSLVSSPRSRSRNRPVGKTSI